jgi:hypothetical protein
MTPDAREKKHLRAVDLVNMAIAAPLPIPGTERRYLLFGCP